MKHEASIVAIKRFIANQGFYFSPLILLLMIGVLCVQVDFRAFYIAGCAVLAHVDPYLNQNVLYSFAHGLPASYFFPTDFFRNGSAFVYTPLTAMLFGLLAHAPYVLAKFIFSVLIAFAFILSLALLNTFDEFDVSAKAIVLLSSSLALCCVFAQGQIDLIILCLVTLSVKLLENERSVFCAALCYAFAIIIKIFPVFFLWLFLYKRQYRFFLLTIFLTVLLFCLPLLVFDSSVYHHYASKLLPSIFGPLTETMPHHLYKFFGQLIQQTHMAVNKIFLCPTSVYKLNPFAHYTVWALLLGNAFTVIYTFMHRRQKFTQLFFASLVMVNLINPRAWLYSLIWYFPFFLLYFSKSNKLGKFILLLPIFLPPSWVWEGNVVLSVMILFIYSTPPARKYLLSNSSLSQVY